MKFLDYIKGQRKGANAHRIEKDAMKDPFLYEAIEGFDSVDDNHMARIGNIQDRIRAKNSNTKATVVVKRRLLMWQYAAVVAVLVFALGGYLFIGKHQSNSLYAQVSNVNIVNVYVPEAYYTENIAVIDHLNTEVVKAVRPNVTRFRVDENTSAPLTEAEIELLSDGVAAVEGETLIDIYVPESFEENRSSQVHKRNGKPEPLIGMEKYKLYLNSALVRPTDDACKDRHGNVFVEFSVNEQGRPYLFEVVYSLCGTSDNEAIRLIQNGPKWTQGTERARVKVEF